MKKLVWILAGLLAILAVAGFFVYPKVRNTWLLNRAQKSFAGGEDRKAALQAMRLIQLDPDNAAATKLIAEITEKNHSPESLRWRLSAARKDPSFENQIALARSAIFYKEWEWADEALRAIEPARRKESTFLQTAGALALAVNRYNDAARFFEKALELEPNNNTLLLNLSITRLAVNDPELKAKGRQDLQRLKAQPEFARAAVAALLQDALSSGSSSDSLARELLALPDLSFADQLAALDALHKASSPDTAELLGDLQKLAVKEPGEIYVLSNWMVRQGKAAEAKQWLDSLSPEEQKQTPVPMAYAECLTALRDWKALQERVSEEKWADSEILRHAFLWRAARELSPHANGNGNAGENDWKASLRGGAVRPAELYLAANLFWSWGWKAEAEEIWWTLAEQTKNPEIALRTLDQIARAEKDTIKLWRISQRAFQTNPRDKVAQNNYAILSILLNRDLRNAHTLAETLYRGQPKNSAFLSTYAFSLYRRNQNKEALKLYATLDPKMLEIPNYAFYYALFLKAAGKDSESERYAKLAEKASLLPEEKALLP